MPRHFIYILFGWLAAQAAWAVKLGDGREAVIAEMGQPTGVIRMPDREMLYYERGTVHLRKDKVIKAELLTADEVRKRREAEAQERVALARAAVEQRLRLKTEGEAVRAKMENDPELLNADAEVVVTRWREFIAKYPEVPPGESYTKALKQYGEQLSREAQERRLADLEFRTSQAEARAAAAVEESRRLRNTVGYSQYPGVSWSDTYYYGTPIVSGYPLPSPYHPWNFKPSSGHAPSSGPVTRPPSATTFKPLPEVPFSTAPGPAKPPREVPFSVRTPTNTLSPWGPRVSGRGRDFP